MNCKHKNTLPLYSRGEKSWKRIDDLYICEDCEAVLQTQQVKLKMKFKKDERGLK